MSRIWKVKAWLEALLNELSVFNDVYMLFGVRVKKRGLYETLGVLEPTAILCRLNITVSG